MTEFNRRLAEIEKLNETFDRLLGEDAKWLIHNLEICVGGLEKELHGHRDHGLWCSHYGENSCDCHMMRIKKVLKELNYD
jgi:hypothetical protein